ncbi:MAG: D-cysteine desulfhydrase family protein [Pseudomonadota bacterium]
MTSQERAQLPPDVSEAVGRLPRATLVSGPTPLEAMPRLGAHLGLDLHVKRDDLTGLGLGGNKVRKLEFYFGKAISEGADVVLITGAVQSNYVRLAAAAAARLGLRCHVQLEERVARADPAYRTNGNVLLDDLFGATRTTFPVGEDEGAADAEIEAHAAHYRSSGFKTFVIPLAADKPPLGAAGYVLGAEELLRQMPNAGAVVVASGSGLTHAGLLFGLRACGWRGPVHGICVRRSRELQTPRIQGHCARLATLLGVAPRVADDDIITDDRMLAPGYGQLNDATTAAVLDAARLEGLVLDPVYTGRVFAGARQLASDGALPTDRPTIVIHTGGVPALFSYEAGMRTAIDARADA